MSIDLEQLLPTFIEESLENVEEMEEALLKLNPATIDESLINQIFRSVHTIKGNSAIFKFSEILAFSKSLENVLDKIRKKEFTPNSEQIDLLLKSSDSLRNMLLEIQQDRRIEKSLDAALMDKIENLFKKAENNESWIVEFLPSANNLVNGNHPENLLEALKNIGKVAIDCDSQKIPTLVEMNPRSCYLSWRISIEGPELTKDKIQDILMWGADLSEIKILSDKVEKREAATNGKKEEKKIASNTIGSIRVATDKIDTLMSTIEELVISQSILKQTVYDLASKEQRKFNDNLDSLDKNARKLQEIILRMRMIPIAFAINRFPRMVLDIAKQEKKEIEFKVIGEQTEIDKTMVEKITDPLMHIIRNAIDHGIESPEEREKKGKPRSGLIEFIAYHAGDNIVIDVKDDGRGLDPEKIKKSAIQKNIISPGSVLSDSECLQLIFKPGFSTAAVVTDISGRGVGLDVVVQNIESLGGKVEVIPNASQGTTFRLRLPLTLAIMDCQLIRVGSQFYALPLNIILEMVQLEPSKVKTDEKTGELIYFLREDKLKLIYLDAFLFLHQASSEELFERKFLIKIKSGGKVFCVCCDELLSQQQIVVKNIDDNYLKVKGILGASVLGDGNLALILDVKEIEEYMREKEGEFSQKQVEKQTGFFVKNEKKESIDLKESKKRRDYLCFLAANKEYGFNVESIEEVCVLDKKAILPFSLPFIEGIMHFRGKMIPLLSAAILFGFKKQESSRKVVIVIQVKNNKNQLNIGLVVDSITAIYSVDSFDIETIKYNPLITIKPRVEAVANIKEKMIGLLRTDDFIDFSDKIWGVL